MVYTGLVIVVVIAAFYPMPFFFYNFTCLFFVVSVVVCLGGAKTTNAHAEWRFGIWRAGRNWGLGRDDITCAFGVQCENEKERKFCPEM